MSIEAVKSFIERIKNDSEFAQKVLDCKDYHTCTEFLQEADYKFTAEELQDSMNILTEKELEGVAGGLSRTPVNTEFSDIINGILNNIDDVLKAGQLQAPYIPGSSVLVSAISNAKK